MNNLLLRDRRSRAERLTIELPIGTRKTLKILAAQREVTIRAFVTNLLQTAPNKKEIRHESKNY